MSTRGSVLLAIGMLILGLILGLVSGGVAGFFVGQNLRVALSRNVTSSTPFVPGQPFSPRRAFPQTPSASTGVQVTTVTPNSPAATAGLQTGDIITAANGTRIDSSHSFASLIQAHKPGDKVTLSVTRGSQTLSISVVLGASPQNSSTAYLGIEYAPTFFGGQRFFTPNNNLPSG